MTMSRGDRLTLFAYRMRPLEPVTLGIAVAAALGVGVVMIPGAPPGTPAGLTLGEVTTPLTMVSMGLALTVGFVVGNDVDVAEPLLSSAPRPYRRALVVRLALWAVVLVAVVATLSARGANALEVSLPTLRGQALVHLLFASALTVVLARTLGSLAGGGAVLATVAVLAGVPLVFSWFPVDLLASANTAEWRTTALRLDLTAVALLLTAYRRARP